VIQTVEIGVSTGVLHSCIAWRACSSKGLADLLLMLVSQSSGLFGMAQPTGRGMVLSRWTPFAMLVKCQPWVGGPTPAGFCLWAAWQHVASLPLRHSPCSP
jgi:hypothetical protein